MRVGIAADHGGFALKEELLQRLQHEHRWVDFGAHALQPDDDYPDLVLPLAHAIATGDVERGLAVCGSGLGASMVANRVPGVRAGLAHDTYSARQGVEHDAMNLLCLGGRVVGTELAVVVVQAFLSARYLRLPRHARRLAAIERLDTARVASRG